jgi:WhiB family redox-sensing transcriptional regulator
MSARTVDGTPVALPVLGSVVHGTPAAVARGCPCARCDAVRTPAVAEPAVRSVPASPARSRPRATARASARLPGGGPALERAGAEKVWASGLCTQVDPELFFPENGRAHQARTAVAVCRRCPVQTRCLELFGDVVDQGVVGGLTADERKKRRRRRLSGVAA